ncbi:hypothetical protein [Streptomyces sp. NPDC056061]|uniref:beta barrel domain-containing protein n=1 Tax=Streptomyces sp. NPDC056061 TaxID=3345700 RepID=UPI0035DD1517
MNDLMDVKVGDTLILTGSYQRGSTPQEVTVTKVGRVYLYITGHRQGFSRTDGVVNDNYGHDRVRTPGQYAADLEHAELERRLYAAGIERRHGTPARRLSTDAIRRILAIVEEN